MAVENGISSQCLVPHTRNAVVAFIAIAEPVRGMMRSMKIPGSYALCK